MIDLHLHSHYSDGTWAPRNLVEHAVQIGMKHIALSDHDTVDGIDEALQAKRAGRPVNILFNLSGHGFLDISAYDRQE